MMGPQPVAGLDVQLSQALSLFHRLRWISLVAVLTIVVALLAGGIVTVARQQQQIGVQQQELNVLRRQLAIAEAENHASCGIWTTLAGAPVAATPPARVPSLLGVVLILEARAAFLGQHCGTLPAAAPTLSRWAAYYHLNIP
jgi:hypothetical protein